MAKDATEAIDELDAQPAFGNDPEPSAKQGTWPVLLGVTLVVLALLQLQDMILGGFFPAYPEFLFVGIIAATLTLSIYALRKAPVVKRSKRRARSVRRTTRAAYERVRTDATRASQRARDQYEASGGIRRDRQQRMISGICAGLANYWKVDVSLVRVATVAATLLTSGFLIVLYVILHFIIPAEPATEIN